MLTTIKLYNYTCYTVKIYKTKIYKNNPNKFFKRGAARPVRRSRIRLCNMHMCIYFQGLYADAHFLTISLSAYTFFMSS